MFCNLKCFKTFLAFIFAASIISIGGGYNSNDIDFLEAQNQISAGSVITTLPHEAPALYSFKSGAIMPPVPFSLVDTFTILAPGSPNNGGSAGWAMFLDLIAGPRNINVTQMSTASTAAASGSFSVEVFTRHGTALGGPVGSGPGSSTAGWTSIGTVPVIQGSTASGISLVFNLPTITVLANDTVGVALKFNTAGPRYLGSGSPPLSVLSDTNLTVVTGDGRSAPFTPTGSWFSSRALTGVVRYVIGAPLGIGNNGTEIPDGFNLSQNYPNPFNPVTKIRFSLPHPSEGGEHVKLLIYDALGKLVQVLVNEQLQAGTYEVDWNASQYSSGVYFYSIKAGEFYAVKRMVLVK